MAAKSVKQLENDLKRKKVKIVTLEKELKAVKTSVVKIIKNIQIAKKKQALKAKARGKKKRR